MPPISKPITGKPVDIASKTTFGKLSCLEGNIRMSLKLYISFNFLSEEIFEKNLILIFILENNIGSI